MPNPATPCPLCEFPSDRHQNLQLDVVCDRCGKYTIDNVLSGNSELRIEALRGKHHIISMATRAAFEEGKTLLLTENAMKDIVDSYPVPKTISAAGDEFLLYLVKRQKDFSEYVQTDINKDYFRMKSKSKKELQDVIMHLVRADLIDTNHVPFNNLFASNLLPTKPTAKGSDRAYELQTKKTKCTQCFIAMSFDPTLNDAYDNGIKPAVEKATKLIPFRVDRIEHNNDINDVVISGLRQSVLVIADFTNNRGGVYFEAGFGFGLGVPVIYTCRNEQIHKDGLHFDTEHRNHIFWDSPEDLQKRLIDRIRATLAVSPEHLK